MRESLQLFAFILIVAVAFFLTSLFAMVVRGDFREPAITAPYESEAPMNVSSSLQQKIGIPALSGEGAGSIGAWDFYVAARDRWLSQGPVIEIKEAVGPLAVTDLGVVTVQCDPGYTLVGCSGGMEPDLIDICREQDCGMIGVFPVNQSGDITLFSYTRDTDPLRRNVATGCLSVHDTMIQAGLPRSRPVVHAYCMRAL